eukprot:TRINITY_DN67621_c0_g1_i1.p1 TRINITY_DN67621_c0_g1~~TRINITY_DN67621_c0_g1_i1.p1  ORF type:complete len:106 (-),score=2.84 TRINITY_DN67621_c0_g1_i1:1320-1637(-)
MLSTILTYVALLLLLGFLRIIYVVIIRPFYWAYSQQRKYGDKVMAIYCPLLGFVNYVRKSEKLYNDSFELFQKIHRENPHVKAIASTMMSHELIFLDPELIKEMT